MSLLEVGLRHDATIVEPEIVNFARDFARDFACAIFLFL